MGTAMLSVGYRPARIGLLVREGSLDDLLAAVRLNTLLWGGLVNPIIPIGSDSKLADALVKLFRVDVVCPAVANEALERARAGYDRVAPSSRLGPAGVIQMESGVATVAYLDMLDLITWYWETHGKATTADGDFAALPKWKSDDPLAAAFAVMFGSFESALPLRYDYEATFRRGMRALGVSIGLGAPVVPDLVSRRSPIEVTTQELWSEAPHFWGDGVYFGDPASPSDLLTFWNLRAAGQDLTYVARGALDRLREYTRAQLVGIAQNRRVPERERTASVYYTVATDEELDVLGELLPADTTLVRASCDVFLWNGLNVKPPSFRFASETTVASVEPSEPGYLLTLKLPERSFLARTARQASHAHRRTLVASLRPYGESEFPGHTLAPPLLPQLNEYYSRTMFRDPWSLRAESEGVATFVKLTDDVLTIHPLSHAALMERLFQLAGIRAEPNQAGRIAQRIVGQMGGLESCRVFKIAGVRDLLQGLKADDAIPRNDALRRIFKDGDFRRHDDLYIEQRPRGVELKTGATFDYLLKKDCFRAGLELHCSHCGLKTWRTLAELDSSWRCEYCGVEAKLSLQLKDRGDWRFRKSGLFAKDNNQEGALPVLLALMTLGQVLAHGDFCYSTALNLHADGLRCETDLCIVQREQGLRPFAIAIGECKAAGSPIEADDVANLSAARARLVAAGIPTYLMFARAATAFQAEELDLLRGLAASGTEVVLLTNRELEPYHPYWDDSNGPLHTKYPNSLEDLALNSRMRYLPPTPPSPP